MRSKLVAIVALTIAATVPLGAFASPGNGAQIAEERAAPALFVTSLDVSTFDLVRDDFGYAGGKLLALPAEKSVAVSGAAKVVTATTTVRDREAVAYHLRL